MIWDEIQKQCRLVTTDWKIFICDNGYPAPDIDWRFPHSVGDFDVQQPSDGDPYFEGLVDNSNSLVR